MKTCEGSENGRRECGSVVEVEERDVWAWKKTERRQRKQEGREGEMDERKIQTSKKKASVNVEEYG